MLINSKKIKTVKKVENFNLPKNVKKVLNFQIFAEYLISRI